MALFQLCWRRLGLTPLMIRRWPVVRVHVANGRLTHTRKQKTRGSSSWRWTRAGLNRGRKSAHVTGRWCVNGLAWQAMLSMRVGSQGALLAVVILVLPSHVRCGYVYRQDRTRVSCREGSVHTAAPAVAACFFRLGSTQCGPHVATKT